MILAATAFAVMLQKPQIEVGAKVPDVAVIDMQGKTVRLSSFRGKKLILFNWASW